MEWVIGIIVVVIVLWFIGTMRRGAAVEETFRSDSAIEQSGDWVQVRVRATTERGGLLQWDSKGRTEDEAAARAVDFLNRMAIGQGQGHIVAVTSREVVARSDGGA